METFSLRDQEGVPIDWKLIKVLSTISSISQQGGYFVEAGANDGMTQSNTLLLERKFGWRGLLVEPCIQSYNKCKMIRGNNPLNTVVHGALVSSDDIKTVSGDFVATANTVDYDSLMNSIGGTRKRENRPLVEVPSYTLSALYKQYNLPNIDLMSLDVEGYEIEVLKGIDLSASWAPKVFLIELYNNEKEEVFSMLEPYYKNCGNFTNYKKDDPTWVEHNDYLFIRKDI